MPKDWRAAPLPRPEEDGGAEPRARLRSEELGEALAGHMTEAVYRPYAIVSEADLFEAGAD